jgi:circadian clock protein KaiB
MRKSGNGAIYDLCLYISGPTIRSHRAIMNIRSICEQHVPGRYNLQVIDIFQNPKETAEHDIIAAPTLIKEAPPPVRRFIGDLSDIDKVTKGLAFIAG